MRTEGIKYAGSKLKLLPIIREAFNDLTGVKVVLDGFAGTTRVSQTLADMGLSVICNDRAKWSKVFGECYLKNTYEKKHYEELIAYLNGLTGYSGWFSDIYAGNKKIPFQLHNLQKLDAIRNEIDNMRLTEMQKNVALTSLIMALDKVDNTIGHYVSYLKDYSRRSYNELDLKIPEMKINDGRHQVFESDIFDRLGDDYDACYFDPPYGSNNIKMPASRVRYAAYYHLWTTIVLHDKPEIFGKSARRKDSSDKQCYSPFEDFRKDDDDKSVSIQSVDRLLKGANCRYIILSYSSGGDKISDELCDALATNSKRYSFMSIPHNKNVMSFMKWSNKWSDLRNETNNEYLFLIEK